MDDKETVDEDHYSWARVISLYAGVVLICVGGILHAVFDRRRCSKTRPAPT